MDCAACTHELVQRPLTPRAKGFWFGVAVTIAAFLVAYEVGSDSIRGILVAITLWLGGLPFFAMGIARLFMPILPSLIFFLIVSSLFWSMVFHLAFTKRNVGQAILLVSLSLILSALAWFPLYPYHGLM